jgi:pseudouridine synthase
MEQRLQKLLAAAGLASRRGAEDLIRAGRVTVNGVVAELGQRADPDQDRVCLDGEAIHAERVRYWILHKPVGVLTTVKDDRAVRDGRRTVMELLPAETRNERLFPVGRLDAESEGLLLLTNDGDTAHALLHPSLGTEKEYRVTVVGELTDPTASALAAGPTLEDGPMAPCRVSDVLVDKSHGRTTFHLTLKEGRKRQIRRALQSLGHHVVRLVRIRMGPLELGRLPVGRVRKLSATETEALLAHARERNRGAAAAPKPSEPLRKPPR